MKLVYGVGVNDRSKPSSLKSEMKKEYKLWLQMLRRCYSKLYQDRFPAYVGCTVSENFKSYSYFYEWCQEQIGFNREAWELDKDLLRKGNKIYSEDNCLFIPREINILLLKRSSLRGEHLIGASFDKKSNCFASFISIRGKIVHLGRYDSEIDAHNAYKKAKEYHIKSIADYHRFELDPRAYQAMIDYSVDIQD